MNKAISLLKIRKELQNRKRILNARVDYCKTRGISHLPFAEDKHLVQCWADDCSFVHLISNYFICPTHLCLHCCCGPSLGSCKLNEKGKCTFAESTALLTRYAEEEPELASEWNTRSGNNDGTHSYRSVDDSRARRLSKQFEQGMLRVITNVCNLEESTVAELMAQDVKNITCVLLNNVKDKKDLRLLQTNGESVTFYLLQKMTEGIFSRGHLLFSFNYKVSLQLQNRAKFSKESGIKLKKFAACLKCIQYLLTLRSVKNSIINKL